MAREPFRVPRLNHTETKNFWMCFLAHQDLTPLAGFIDDNGDVTEPFAHAGGPSLGAGSKTLPHAAFVHHRSLDNQTIDIDALGIFGIRHRSPHSLGNDARGALGNKLENV